MKCEVCRINTAQYVCPKCKMQTCSLECVRKHKADTNCDGKKPQTEFVPIDNMNADTLVRDCKLLDAAKSAEVSANMKTVFKWSPKDKWRKLLKQACSDRGITLYYMPLLSSRSRENKSRYVKARSVILWTARWRFRSKDHKIEYETVLNDVNEGTPLIDTVRAIIQTVPNDFVAKLDPNDLNVLLVAEGIEGGGSYMTESEIGLQDNLFTKTIIEYPIFDIVPKEYLDEWKIVTNLPNRKFEVIEETKTKTEAPLPSYDDIKDAIKMDLLKTVLDKAQEEDLLEERPPL